jgi:hypothetical protein
MDHDAGPSQRDNPCQFSPEVLDVLEPLILPAEFIHDPFAGHGTRLAALCDRLGAHFSGTDIEVWRGHDPRVGVADARDPSSYPSVSFTVITSPVYLNKRCADYPNGPTPTTKIRGRRDYGIALGRALHSDNFARFTGRPRRASDYWQGHGEAVKHWGDRAIVNVDLPISDGWRRLLVDHGYRIEQVIPAYTRRYGGLDNSNLRAEHEVVIVATGSACVW